MKVEIEIKSSDAKNEIFDLRNFIQNEMSDFKINIKETPPQEGEMSILGAIGILAATPFGGAILGLAVNKVYDNFIENPLKKWLEKRKKEGKSDIEIITTVNDGIQKMHISTDSEGKTTVFDKVNFALDTENTRVLLIGNSDYDFSFPPIQPVKGNIEDLYEILTDKRKIGIPQENITICFNKTNTEIEEQLLIASQHKNLETLFIYFAGHGHRTDIKKLYLVAKNTKKISDHIIGGIDFDFIKNVVLKQSTAQQKIVILDACHSGIAAQGDDTLVTNFDVKGTYILTSSSGEEVSFFDKNKRNTFFSGEIINLLKNGVENHKEQIALDDIYENVTTTLKQRNLPEPRHKSELNIPISNFYIARNPKFSVQYIKQKPRKLFAEGKFEQALNEYQILLQRFPQDNELKNEMLNCQNEIDFLQLVQQADNYFHKQDFQNALMKYEQALKIKNEMSIAYKKGKCEEYLNIQNKSNTSKAEGLNEYRELFEIFYQDQNISEKERQQLDKIATKYHLSQSEIEQMENEIRQKIIHSKSDKFLNKPKEQKNINQLEKTKINKSKSSIHTEINTKKTGNKKLYGFVFGFCIVFLILLFFIWKPWSAKNLKSDVSLKNRSDSVSYAYGILYISSKASRINYDINPIYFKMGFNDVLQGNAQKLYPHTAYDTSSTYISRNIDTISYQAGYQLGNKGNLDTIAFVNYFGTFLNYSNLKKGIIDYIEKQNIIDTIQAQNILNHSFDRYYPTLMKEEKEYFIQLKNSFKIDSIGVYPNLYYFEVIKKGNGKSLKNINGIKLIKYNLTTKRIRNNRPVDEHNETNQEINYSDISPFFKSLFFDMSVGECRIYHIPSDNLVNTGYSVLPHSPTVLTIEIIEISK